MIRVTIRATEYRGRAGFLVRWTYPNRVNRQSVFVTDRAHADELRNTIREGGDVSAYLNRIWRIGRV